MLPSQVWSNIYHRKKVLWMEGTPLGSYATKIFKNQKTKWISVFSAHKIKGFSSVPKSCLPLCNPMNCSMPGSPVHYQPPEFTQTNVHRVGDAIQPSHPQSSPFPPAPNPSQHPSLLQWVNSSHEVAKLASFLPKNTQGWSSFKWTGWISLKSKGLSRALSNITVQKHQFFGVQFSL